MQSRFRVTWQHFKLLLMWPVAFMHGSKASGSRREVRVRKEILLEKDFHKLYMSRTTSDVLELAVPAKLEARRGPRSIGGLIRGL